MWMLLNSRAQKFFKANSVTSAQKIKVAIESKLSQTNFFEKERSRVSYFWIFFAVVDFPLLRRFKFLFNVTDDVEFHVWNLRLNNHGLWGFVMLQNCWKNAFFQVVFLPNRREMVLQIFGCFFCFESFQKKNWGKSSELDKDSLCSASKKNMLHLWWPSQEIWTWNLLKSVHYNYITSKRLKVLTCEEKTLSMFVVSIY